METQEEYTNPSKLFIAFMDSFNEPLCLLDENGNFLMNEKAQKMNESGFELKSHSKKCKIGISVVTYKGKKYNLEKKDINHGTHSFLCTFKLEDDTITRLTESSKKLKKVLSAL